MKSTSSVAQVLNNTTVQLPTGVTNLNQLSTGSCTVEEADKLCEMYPDLVNQQFKAWYCKKFYALPRDKVIQLASQAYADGHNPARLFSYLLKKAQ